jgi:vacuolar protein sorting-associated protein 35
MSGVMRRSSSSLGPGGPAGQSGPEQGEQGRRLEEALQAVRLQAFHVRRSLEAQRLTDALRHASTLLGELRTSSLTPRHYYQLYMAAFDELQLLAGALHEGHVAGRHVLSELYELVQYAGNLVPRLYLMITVGSAWLRVLRDGAGPGSPTAAAATSPAAAATAAGDLMNDMLEMSRGVQHATRGLFLRYYLSTMCREYLPDAAGRWVLLLACLLACLPALPAWLMPRH